MPSEKKRRAQVPATAKKRGVRTPEVAKKRRQAFIPLASILVVIVVRALGASSHPAPGHAAPTDAGAVAPTSAGAVAPTNAGAVAPTAPMPSHAPDGVVGRDTSATGATLMLTASPPGVVVSVDGHDVGALPITMRGLAPGRHVVSALLPAFEPFERALDLHDADVESVVVRLDPVGDAAPGEFGYLTVVDATPGRTVTALGTTIGTTPLTRVPVPAGAFSVSIAGARGTNDERAVVVTTQHETIITARPSTARPPAARPPTHGAR